MDRHIPDTFLLSPCEGSWIRCLRVAKNWNPLAMQSGPQSGPKVLLRVDDAASAFALLGPASDYQAAYRMQQPYPFLSARHAGPASFPPYAKVRFEHG
jgi:hypothetical protein